MFDDDFGFADSVMFDAAFLWFYVFALFGFSQGGGAEATGRGMHVCPAAMLV